MKNLFVIAVLTFILGIMGLTGITYAVGAADDAEDTVTVMQDAGLDAGVFDAGLDAGVDGGIGTSPDDATVKEAFAALFSSVKDGNWGLALIALLMLAVAGVRTFKWPAWFNTTTGGWVLNFVASFIGAISAALGLGLPITAATVLNSFVIALAAAGSLELYKDISGWIKKKQA